MARNIHRNRKSRRINFTLEILKKQFPQVEWDELNKEDDIPRNVKKCDYKDSNEYGCVATITYCHYSWGVTKKGHVHFCCPSEKYDLEDEFINGHLIISKFQPTLEKILKGK